jgi:hypothetical protein
MWNIPHSGRLGITYAQLSIYDDIAPSRITIRRVQRMCISHPQEAM